MKRLLYLALMPFCFALVAAAVFAVARSIDEPLLVGADRSVRVWNHRLRFHIGLELARADAQPPAVDVADSTVAVGDSLCGVSR